LIVKRTRFHGNHRETAELLGISEQALWKAVRDRGAPVVGRDGQETMYDWREVLAWRITDLMPDDLDLNRERARLAAAQADRTEMQLAESRGELIPRARVLSEVGDYIDACRKRLSAVASTVAQYLDRETALRVEPILTGRIGEAVAELREYRPSVARRDPGAVDAAAGPDGQPVGGPAPAPAARKRRRARAVED
jgi:phage terminase Nu1 subunit (DNA packaging protein)